MRRSFVMSMLACALALAPAFAYAQDPAAAAPAQPAPAAPKVPFTTPAGMLLVQIKPDQPAVFEEMVGKINAGLARTGDATFKQLAGGLKVYKSSDPLASNALYVVLAEPTVPNADYDLFDILYKTMTDDEKRAEGFKEMWAKYVGAFAAGLNKISLTPLPK